MEREHPAQPELPRETVRPGRTLPPLRQARTRIMLLAGSYLDALTASNDGTIGGAFESRLPSHNEELWPHGSYAELERAMRDIPPGVRVWFNAFWRVYVVRGSRLVLARNGRPIGYEGDPVTVRRPRLDSRGKQIVDGAGHKRWHEETTRQFKEFPLNEVVKADQVLAQVEDRLRGGAIYVPAQVSEAAGYLPGEAKAYDRWPEKDAA